MTNRQVATQQLADEKGRQQYAGNAAGRKLEEGRNLYGPNYKPPGAPVVPAPATGVVGVKPKVIGGFKTAADNEWVLGMALRHSPQFEKQAGQWLQFAKMLGNAGKGLLTGAARAPGRAKALYQEPLFGTAAKNFAEEAAQARKLGDKAMLGHAKGDFKATTDYARSKAIGAADSRFTSAAPTSWRGRVQGMDDSIAASRKGLGAEYQNLPAWAAANPGKTLGAGALAGAGGVAGIGMPMMSNHYQQTAADSINDAMSQFDAMSPFAKAMMGLQMAAMPDKFKANMLDRMNLPAGIARRVMGTSNRTT
jgi:hypothetical protein